MNNDKKSIGLRVSMAMQYARRAGSVRTIAATLPQGIYLGLLTASLSSHTAYAVNDATHEGAVVSVATESESVAPHRSKRANFGQESASPDARNVADWVVDSGDNRSFPFAIVDKTDAKVLVFQADGRLDGAAPALVGQARGDDAVPVPGIVDRELSSIRPDERITPAGRFVAALGHNVLGNVILWVDYDNAISMHPVITTNPKERRLQRLATPTPLDNRITYGCINVSAKFYENVVRPAFTATQGIVYVLPETRSIREVFPSYDINARATQAESQHLPAPVSSQNDANSPGQ